MMKMSYIPTHKRGTHSHTCILGLEILLFHGAALIFSPSLLVWYKVNYETHAVTLVDEGEERERKGSLQRI